MGEIRGEFMQVSYGRRTHESGESTATLFPTCPTSTFKGDHYEPLKKQDDYLDQHARDGIREAFIALSTNLISLIEPDIPSFAAPPE